MTTSFLSGFNLINSLVQILILGSLSPSMCFCRGDFGRLGHGNSSDLFTPLPIKALHGVRIKQIACGDSHCLAVTMEGEVQRYSQLFFFSLCLFNNHILNSHVNAFHPNLMISIASSVILLYVLVIVYIPVLFSYISLNFLLYKAGGATRMVNLVWGTQKILQFLGRFKPLRFVFLYILLVA